MRSTPSVFVSILAAVFLLVGLPSVVWGGPGGGGTPIVCNANEDSTQDLAFAGTGSTDRVNLMSGGDSSSASFTPTGGGAWALQACEKFGSAALVAEGASGGAVNFLRVQLLDATGSFTGASNFVSTGGGDFGYAATADVDGDGFQDVILEGEGGTPAAGIAKISFVVGSNAGTSIFVGLGGGTWTFGGKGDVDADNDEDIIWQNGSGNLVRIDLSNGTSAPASNVRNLGGFTLAAVGDVTGDNKADLILNSASSAKIQQLDGATFMSSLFRGNGGGTFPPGFVLDANNDGTGDVAYVGASSSRIDLMSDTSLAVDSNGFVGNGGFTPILVGDFDADGNEDIAGQNASFVQTTLLNGASLKGRGAPIGRGGGVFSLVD